MVVVESSSLKFIVPCWWHHDHVTATRALTWATKALKRLKKEKQQTGLNFRVDFWGALVLGGHLASLFGSVFCDVLCFNSVQDFETNRRNKAPALVQQAGDEDQCDSIPQLRFLNCLVATCCALTFVNERFDESSSEVCGSKILWKRST